MRKDYRKIILDILDKHPEGLSLTEIARFANAHRYTVTKYIYEMIGAGKVYERIAGVTKLCYTKKHYIRLFGKPKGKGQAKGQLQILAALLFLLLVPSTIILAQNMTANFSQSNYSFSENPVDSTVVDLCADVICIDSSVTCSDGYIASCSNSCDPLTGECGICVPDCTGHEKVSECSVCSASIKGQTSQVENQTQTSQIPENLGLNETTTTSTTYPNETTTTTTSTTTTTIPNETNETTTTTTTTMPNETTTTTTTQTSTTTTTLPELKPEITIEIFSPSKAMRGEDVEIVANVSNVGSANAENVVLEWQLPVGFEIVSGNQTMNCGVLTPGSFCEAAITVRLSYQTVLGIDEIRAVVRYDG